MSRRNAEGHAAVVLNYHVVSVKVIAIAMQTARAASDAELTTAKEGSFTMETTAARTSATEEIAAALKNILAGRVKEIVTAIPSVEMASSVGQTIARKGQLLKTVTTVASRYAPPGLMAKTGRASQHAPPLEAQQEAWSASSPSNTKVSPTTLAHLWTTTTRTGAALKVGGAIVAHHAQGSSHRQHKVEEDDAERSPVNHDQLIRPLIDSK